MTTKLNEIIEIPKIIDTKVKIFNSTKEMFKSVELLQNSIRDSIIASLDMGIHNNCHTNWTEKDILTNYKIVIDSMVDNISNEEK